MTNVTSSTTNKEILVERLGVLSRKSIPIRFFDPGKPGIFFILADGSEIPATADHLISATRNSVLGNGKASLCFVEHLLGAISFLGLEQIGIEVKGEEIPLEDGSGLIWYNLLKSWGRKDSHPTVSLSESLDVTDNQGRGLYAVPADKFQITYLFQSPVDQAQSWTSWSLGDDPLLLASARTFAGKLENEMIGLVGKVLSFDSAGFDLPFRFPDEPARHKLFDLLGDLALSGLNPLTLKAHFISLKGGHALNTSMAKKIRQALKSD